jgi:hypothetical protein
MIEKILEVTAISIENTCVNGYIILNDYRKDWDTGSVKIKSRLLSTQLQNFS